jgi:hypothetical protein
MVGIFYCSRTLYVLGRANAAERPVGNRYWIFTASFELILVMAMIGITEYLAPKERTIDDLSAPVTLLIPLLVVLSVMRLRPRITLSIGVVGGVFHAALAGYAFMRSEESASVLPTVFTYSAMLIILGVAGSAVSSELLNLARGSRRELSEPMP